MSESLFLLFLKEARKAAFSPDSPTAWAEAGIRAIVAQFRDAMRRGGNIRKVYASDGLGCLVSVAPVRCPNAVVSVAAKVFPAESLADAERHAYFEGCSTWNVRVDALAHPDGHIQFVKTVSRP